MTENDALLVAYVDGELGPEAAREAEALIAADPQARQAVEIYRQTAALLRSACNEQAYAADAKRLLPLPGKAARRAPRRVAWGLAAALAACALGFLGGARWGGILVPGTSEFASEVAEYHAVYARETRHLVEVPAEQRDDLTTWLSRRIERPLVVPDLADEGLRFAGARMLVVNGQPVAQLMYTRAGGLPVALCIAKQPGTDVPLRQDQFGAQRTASWRNGGYAYVLVGEVGEGAMRELAAEAARQIPRA